MDDIQSAKALVRQFVQETDAAELAQLSASAAPYVTDDLLWRGMHPFYEIQGYDEVIQTFWAPLRGALQHLQRREDIFFGGRNDADGHKSVWTCSMGHFMGLFDEDWLGIPKTRRIASLRYAEFMRVEAGRICEMALFVDILGLMHQAGVYPLPPMTGNYFIYPGPRTNDGVQLSGANAQETEKTMSLVNRMVADLSSINQYDDYKCPPEILRKSWHEDMAWYGPCGIGASYTIERYQAQHQYPFRLNLTDKTYNGHIARFAEGNYAGFFGWSNLSNRNTGGFLGLPEAAAPAEMRVVDVYRRCGDKLAENWVLIDLPFYLKQQGLDVLERMTSLRLG